MGKEIERKFLVTNHAYRHLDKGKLYRQGFLSVEPERVIRIRAVEKKATLTIKAMGKGITRDEYEYEIPFSDARDLLANVCIQPLIEKIRYCVQVGTLTWEVDEFLGENRGLIIAEVEIENESDPLDVPDWVGEEVTHDLRYYNNHLVKNPYKNWG
ncbi:MAG: CYTH domain-containing protein [Bacteroidetes bacterium]|nr:CYTH domain-containing protein [Bacteroidota bacterium]